MAQNFNQLSGREKAHLDHAQPHHFAATTTVFQSLLFRNNSIDILPSDEPESDGKISKASAAIAQRLTITAVSGRMHPVPAPRGFHDQ
jgi:hypothetical protein